MKKLPAGSRRYIMAKDRTKNLFGTELDESPDASGQIVRVALDTGADSLFDYVVPEFLGTVGAGQRVQVPFGKANKLQQAFVVQNDRRRG